MSPGILRTVKFRGYEGWACDQGGEDEE